MSNIFKEFAYGGHRFIRQMTWSDGLFIAVMKMLWERFYFRVIRRVIVAVYQTSLGSLFPVKRILPCFTEPDVHVCVIVKVEA